MKHPNVISSKINAINEVTNLSLAKYEVINHPLNPLRLTQVVYMLSKILHLAFESCDLTQVENEITTVVFEGN